MMFNTIAPIAEALTKGWGAKTILQKLAQKFPKLQPFVRHAETAGFLSPSILRKIMNPEQSAEANTESEQAFKKYRDTKRNLRLAAVGTLGAVGAGIAGLSKLGQGGAKAKEAQAAQGISSDGGGGPFPPGIPPGGGGNGPGGGQPSPFEGAKQVAEKFPTNFDLHFPELGKFVQKHVEAGYSPEEIYELGKKSLMLNPLIKSYEEQTGHSYFDKISEISGKKLGGVQSGIENLILTPFGPGQVHKTHGDSAYVEVDNKLKKVPLNEVEDPPEDYVEAVNKILKIPEIDRSSNVALFVYDPDESKAFFQFHDGSFYKYLDIDPEVVRKISEKEATPITRGENVYGAWSPEDPHGSLGAALWAYVLKDPKYAKAKKGEPENPNYKKLQVLSDYWVKLRKKRKR